MTDPIYFIELKFSVGAIEFNGDRQWTKRDVIDRIIAGEWGRNVRTLKVLEIREDENRCEDITEEIAQEVAQRFADDREEVSYAVMNFLHDHHPRGVMSTHGLNVAA